MSEPDAELLEAFRDEATQRLDEVERALVAVESGEADAGVTDVLFRHLHTIKGAAGIVGLDDVSEVAHAAEDILAAVREAGTFPPGLAGPLLRATAVLRARVAGEEAPAGALVGELAASLSALRQPPPAAPPRPRPAPPEPVLRQPEPSLPGPAAERRSVRVAPGRVDHLLDVVGEALQDGRRLAHALGPEASTREDIADALGAAERTLGELKDTAIRMRTLPLSAVTGPLPRVVRDLARAAGKDVGFTVTGTDTELDRVIVLSLADPLMHLLRNAVAHGIETPAERERTGKPPRGQLDLRAVPRGSRVEIIVSDDGRGVSPEVAEQARREGSLADVLASAGYSTAGKVTELAGRGVGLDAVKAYAHSLGGNFQIRSEPGHGMEVMLRVPLALALLDVLLFERGGAVFGVPLAAVEEVTSVAATGTIQGRSLLDVRGRALPVSDFAALRGAAAPPLRERSPALVLTAAGRRHVVACDKLIGQEEVTVKPLGPLLARVRGYLGATILGDGRIALLAEPAALLQGRHVTGRPAVPPPEQAAKILVVEDSFTVRELQRSILEAAGYRVVTARDGGEALRVVTRDAGIGLVVTDLEMPEVDGLELTRAIRADPARASLPIVVVTSRGTEEDRRKGIAAGADAYMVKRDFSQQALLATVERLIGR